MRELLTFFENIASVYPVQLLGICIGLLFSWGATQRIKFLFPKTWAIAKYTAWTRAVATLTAMMFSYFTQMALEVYNHGNLRQARPLAIVLAIGVSMASPILYTAAMRVLYHFFPWMESKVSGRPGE